MFCNLLNIFNFLFNCGKAGFRESKVQCLDLHGLHSMSYVEWGNSANPRVLICAHGLTRNGRDFDFLARHLSKDYRVVCPDIVGRGKSDWLKDPNNYGVPLYVNDIVTLIARLNVQSVDWIGTSMGGLIGMALAAQPNTPIRKLVLNDAGPVLRIASLKRIGQYVGKGPNFSDLASAERYIREISVPFGPLSDEQWRHLTVHVVRKQPDGSYKFVYDPNISLPFNGMIAGGRDIEMWQYWDAIKCSTLVLRGAQSDLLLPDTAQQMMIRGPRAKIIEIPGVGHSPMLMNQAQIQIVKEFLLT